jgi:hypothetical protein
MSDEAHDMLVRGVASAKAGENHLARRYLERALELKPTAEQREKAWYWLSEVCEAPEEKRRYLTDLLSARPNDMQARRKLAILDGRLKPEAVIDPDRLPAGGEQPIGQADARRFVCPQCGGRLTFSPDGVSLTCESCEVQQGIPANRWLQAGEQEMDEYAIAMSTIKGHSRPLVGPQQVECAACGASFEVETGCLSGVCAYCRSVFVVEHVEGEHHFGIEAVIPFAVDEPAVQKILRAWISERSLRKPRFDELRSFYLPAWLFHLSGAVMGGSVLIPASRAFPVALLDRAVDDFDLGALTAFAPAYLVNRDAEIYQTSLAQASLAARFKALEKVKQDNRDIWSRMVEAKRPRISSMDLIIDQFDLVLLPFWRWGYSVGNEQYVVLVNGQTGELYETSLRTSPLKA